ncbi:hypothetical protein HNQ75_004114 [Rhizobium flavum]|uniref:Uncharacterized protein n=1 Tax=Pseudorhizobium flavum TaxID=1335061 RepID=A0A7W9Z154_9HYPH|nr:hypothetical protein [Pseudorhizobium flavum]
MEIAHIPLTMRLMDGEIDGGPITICQVLREFTRQGEPFAGIQLMRKRDLKFPGDPGILALLYKLDLVPKGGAVTGPIGRDTSGEHDFSMLHPLLSGEVMNEAIPFIQQL